jgi:hypothetical protein
MILLLPQDPPFAVVDRIEEDIAVLEVSCSENGRRNPTDQLPASPLLGRRGDSPPPQRLPPRAATTARRNSARDSLPALPPARLTAALLPDAAAPVHASVRFVDLSLSDLPAGLREGDLVPLAGLSLPPSDVCSGHPRAHGASEGPGRRPDTTRARALSGMP